MLLKNTWCLFLIFCFCFNTFAQRRTGPQIIRGGLVKVGFHAGPSFLLKPSVASGNVGGELEIYLNKRISVRGDISFNIPTPQSIKVLTHNHSLYWGFNYHMPYKKLDFLIGLQPGLSIVQGYKKDGNLALVQGIPIITALGGCQFYFSRFVHCYALVRFITGTYFSNAGSPLSMSEFRLKIGVGFHINIVPLKKMKVQ